MYFDEIQNLFYDFPIAGKTVLFVLKDITTNVRIKKEVLENITLYDEYDIIDGDTPEIISEKVYGSPYYHWVIMLVNQRYDYISDFPLPQRELEKFITQKYGAGNEYAVHHYVDANGFIVDSSVVGVTSVSNSDFEAAQNERKRRIKIISPSLLPQVLKQFKDLV